MRRRNVPCSPCSGGSSSGDCCGLKEKLRILWDRTIGSILRINGISPDGDGDFTIEAGSNIAITERGTGNGLRIDTTGGVSYYTSGDSYVNVDNNDLEISVNVGTGGLATDTDLQTVAGAVTDILDGTSTVPNATNAVNATNATNATNAQYLGSATSTIGNDSKPIKIVNGQAYALTYDVINLSASTQIKQGIIGCGQLYLASSDYIIKPVSDGNGTRIQLQCFNTNSPNYGILELKSDNNGDVVLFMQKRRRSDDTYLGGSTIATL